MFVGLPLKLCLRLYSLAKGDLELILSWFQLLSAHITDIYPLVGFMGEPQGFLHVRHLPTERHPCLYHKALGVVFTSVRVDELFEGRYKP